MGTAASAVAGAEATDGTTELGSSTSHQWHLVDSANGRAVAGLAGTIWELVNGRQPVLPLARGGRLGTGLGTVASRSRRGGWDRLGGPPSGWHCDTRSPACGEGKKTYGEVEALGRSQ